MTFPLIALKQRRDFAKVAAVFQVQHRVLERVEPGLPQHRQRDRFILAQQVLDLDACDDFRKVTALLRRA